MFILIIIKIIIIIIIIKIIIIIILIIILIIIKIIIIIIMQCRYIFHCQTLINLKIISDIELCLCGNSLNIIATEVKSLDLFTKRIV